MNRSWYGVLACAASFAVTVACVTQPVKPLDAQSVPTTVTSAQPLYLSSQSDASAEAAAKQPDSGQVPQGPTSSAVELPQDGEVDMDRSASCGRSQCWRPLLPRPHELGTSPFSAQPETVMPAAVWQERLGSGAKLEFPRARGVQLLGVVLSGVATAAPVEGGTLAALQSWGTFSAPGAGVRITAAAQGADVLLIAYQSDGKLEQTVEAVRRTPGAVYWTVRPGRFSVGDLRRSDPRPWIEGLGQARAAFSDQNPSRPYVGSVLIAADRALRQPALSEWRLLIPIRAAGTVRVLRDGSSESTTANLKPGQVLAFAPGATSEWQLDQASPFVAIEVRVPTATVATPATSK